MISWIKKILIFISKMVPMTKYEKEIYDNICKNEKIKAGFLANSIGEIDEDIIE